MRLTMMERERTEWTSTEEQRRMIATTMDATQTRNTIRCTQMS